MAIALMACSFAAAQLTVEQVAATNKVLQQVQSAISKLPPAKQQMLLGHANLNHLATVWQNYGMRFTDPTFIAHAKAVTAAPMLSFGGTIIPVSNPSTDVAYSAFAGFTQSETSTARCGNAVVVGFNDSGSIFETPLFFTGMGGESFSGASYSTNGGASFTDIGPINPGSNDFNFLGGSPVVNCADPNTFYFTQIFDYLDASQNPWSAIAINKSTDGGRTWGDPLPAIAKSGTNHVLDSPWSTIDPSNHKRIFVSYTDFDYSGTSAACGTNFRIAIEFVESDDGGATWSATPNVAIEACSVEAVEGSQMVVSSNGTLYIAWLNYGPNFPSGPRAIQISSYAKGVLSGPVTVDSAIQPGGDSYFLQGEFKDTVDMSLAIDHSGTISDGMLYITWADGRDKTVTDPFAQQGYYAYTDVFLRTSDGGHSWGAAPSKVNSDTQPRLGNGRDHYQPGVAVDNRGWVGICWYDRRMDTENFAIRRHCAESSNYGASFNDSDIGMAGFAPTHGDDLFMDPAYMGYYDQMTSDFLNQHSGFIGSFQNQTNRGNPDVYAHPMN